MKYVAFLFTFHHSLPYTYNLSGWIKVMALLSTGNKSLLQLMMNQFTDAQMHHSVLTHWGSVMHIYVNELTVIGPSNGLVPSQHQAIVWTNAELLLIVHTGTNFSEILI